MASINVPMVFLVQEEKAQKIREALKILQEKGPAGFMEARSVADDTMVAFAILVSLYPKMVPEGLVVPRSCNNCNYATHYCELKENTIKIKPGFNGPCSRWFQTISMKDVECSLPETPT